MFPLLSLADVTVTVGNVAALPDDRNFVAVSFDIESVIVADTNGDPLDASLISGWFCFSSTIDSDGDAVYNYEDNCPDDANGDQADANNNGIGDVCEETLIELAVMWLLTGVALMAIN